MNQVAGRLVFLLTGAVLLGCGDYEIPLQSNYIIARTSSNMFIVVAPDRHVVLGPSVDLYAQHDGLLIGRVVDETSSPSYFVLDMNSGRLSTWKEETLWRNELARRNIPESRLQKPSRLGRLWRN